MKKFITGITGTSSTGNTPSTAIASTAASNEPPIVEYSSSDPETSDSDDGKIFPETVAPNPDNPKVKVEITDITKPLMPQGTLLKVRKSKMNLEELNHIAVKEFAPHLNGFPITYWYYTKDGERLELRTEEHLQTSLRFPNPKLECKFNVPDGAFPNNSY